MDDKLKNPEEFKLLEKRQDEVSIIFLVSSFAKLLFIKSFYQSSKKEELFFQNPLSVYTILET